MDCHFRRIPPPRNEQDEMSAEPWYSVGEGDVFPEELRRFLGFGGPLRDAFLREHSALFEPEFWQGMQERHRDGEVIDFFPYSEERRLRNGGSA